MLEQLLVILTVFTPVTLIHFGIIPRKLRLGILFCIFILALFWIIFQDISFFNLGFRFDNINTLLLPYLLATLLGFIFIKILSVTLKKKEVKNWNSYTHLQYKFIPISFAQQFLFQGLFFYILTQALTPIQAIFLNALSFGYLHTIFPKPTFSFIFGSLAGLYFGALYAIFPNIILISIMHALLNHTAVRYGYFSFIK